MNLIERIKAFRIAAYAHLGEYPGLKVSRTYVEEMDWQEGHSINYEFLDGLANNLIAQQRAQDHAARSYALLKQVSNLTHQDAHGRIIISQSLWLEITNHINMLEAT